MDISNVINAYHYGSHVYGTNNEQSDKDYIIVSSRDSNPSNNTYSITEFQQALDNQYIWAIECFFLPLKFIVVEQHKFKYKLDKGQLRKSISTITNNSWSKGKQKLTKMDAYDCYRGIKSIFHSIRILDYGIQLCLFESIKDYSRVNYIWEDLYKAYLEDTVTWDWVQSKFHKIYKQKLTEFKQLCPKDNIPEHRLKQDLINLFEENNCYSKEVIESKLINKIVELVTEQL